MREARITAQLAIISLIDSYREYLVIKRSKLNHMLTKSQAQPASYQADLYAFHLRHRYDANPIRHGSRERYHHSGELADVWTDMIGPTSFCKAIQRSETSLRSGFNIHCARVFQRKVCVNRAKIPAGATGVGGWKSELTRESIRCEGDTTGWRSRAYTWQR